MYVLATCKRHVFKFDIRQPQCTVEGIFLLKVDSFWQSTVATMHILIFAKARASLALPRSIDMATTQRQRCHLKTIKKQNGPSSL
jgi:hypothetical protein